MSSFRNFKRSRKLSRKNMHGGQNPPPAPPLPSNKSNNLGKDGSCIDEMIDLLTSDSEKHGKFCRQMGCKTPDVKVEPVNLENFQPRRTISPITPGMHQASMMHELQQKLNRIKKNSNQPKEIIKKPVPVPKPRSRLRPGHITSYKSEEEASHGMSKKRKRSMFKRSEKKKNSTKGRKKRNGSKKPRRKAKKSRKSTNNN